MAKNNNLTDFVTDLADAIRAKCKTTGTINPQDFSKFVGGMPFFKFRETLDITAKEATANYIPNSYSKTYVKGEIYLTNDNGLTEVPNDDSALIQGIGAEIVELERLFSTTERYTISGNPWSELGGGFLAFFDNAATADALIQAGWHIKIDIYDLCMGDPDGEYTKIDLTTQQAEGFNNGTIYRIFV